MGHQIVPNQKGIATSVRPKTHEEGISPILEVRKWFHVQKPQGSAFPLPKFSQFNKESLDSSMRETGEQTKPKPLPNPDIPTAELGSSLVIDGEVNTDQNLFVAGIVRGRLRSQAKLTISESAIVEGPIHGAIVIIEGRVQGTIQAQERIQLVKGAIVHGDLIAPKVDISDGATFQGKLLLVR